MFELLEKAILTGLGAAALSQKMAEEFVKDLKEKYKVSEDEGKAFLDKLQDMAKEGRAKLSAAAEEEVKKAMDRMGVVSREEFLRLQKRVELLESAGVGREPGPGEPC